MDKEYTMEELDEISKKASIEELVDIVDGIAEERGIDLVATCKFCGEKVHSAIEALAHRTECTAQENQEL